MRLINTRGALHEALDLLIDAIEADMRGPEQAPRPKKLRRIPRQPPPLPDPSTVRPEVVAAMARR